LKPARAIGHRADPHPALADFRDRARQRLAQFFEVEPVHGDTLQIEQRPFIALRKRPRPAR